MKRSDDGSVTVLTIGLVSLVLVALVGVTQAAHVFLQQRSLAGVCDGAAEAAVQALDTGALYASDVQRLDEGQAQTELARWLARPGTTTDAPGARASVTGLTAGRRGVRVTCTRAVSSPFGLPDRTLRAHSVAELP